MNCNLRIEIDDTVEDITLKQPNPKEVVWIGNVHNDNNEDYAIQIKVTNKDDENFFEVKIGKDIKNSVDDIKEQFDEFYLEFQKQLLSTGADGIEPDDENDDNGEEKPYDPDLIRVDPKQFMLMYLYEMMTPKENEVDLDLAPDFQRNFVWDLKRQSRLIESLLLRIPLPVFYFAETEDNGLQVIDGLQRLTTLKNFLSNKFKLKDLEYLKDDCDGRLYKTLDKKYIRRLDQTQIFANVIDLRTPSKVKFDIFKRINTGGRALNNQEIRNCLSTPKVRKFLRDLAISKEFKDATGGSVKQTRFADQELVLRFIAFYLVKKEKIKDLVYKGKVETLLDTTLDILNKSSTTKLVRYAEKFNIAMNNAFHLFGKYAFRKFNRLHIENDRRPLINKSLFVTFSVELSDYTYFTDRSLKNKLIKIILKEIENNKLYDSYLTTGTSDELRLNYTFQKANELIKKVMTNDK